MPLTEEGIIKVPGLLSRWVRLGTTGVKAHYVTAGETGPAVILLHGGIAGSSGTAGWQFMAPFLGANGFRVYCPDMPAFGLTSDPEGAYRTGSGFHTDFIHDFANALCLDEFFLAGNSNGCVNTVYYTVAHPERVKRFALIAGYLGNIVPWDDFLASDPRTPEERGAIHRFDGTRESMRESMRTIIHRDVAISDDLIDMRMNAALRHREAHQARNEADNGHRTDPLMLVRNHTKDRIDRVPIPGIYLFGRNDVLFPLEMAYIQEDAVPDIQFFYPDNTGHQGQTDQPELFNQVFLEFFRDGKISAATAARAGVSTRRPVNPNIVEME